MVCYQRSHSPLVDRMSFATFRTSGGGKLCSTVWAYALGLKSIEGLLAICALPVIACRRRGFAIGARKTLATRQLCQFSQGLGVSQTAPAVQEHEDGKGGEPDRAREECEDDETGYTEETENACGHQAARTPYDEPSSERRI